MKLRPALLLVCAVAVVLCGSLLGCSPSQTPVELKSVSALASDPALVGRQVRVTGEIVPRSWSKQNKPMTFSIADTPSPDATPTVRIVYEGPIPSTFGDGVTVIAVGKLEPGNTITTSDMITKIPSKY